MNPLLNTLEFKPKVQEKIPVAISKIALEDDWSPHIQYVVPPSFSFDDYINYIATGTCLYTPGAALIDAQQIDEILSPIDIVNFRNYPVSGSGATEEDMLYTSPSITPFNYDELKERRFARLNDPRIRKV